MTSKLNRWIARLLIVTVANPVLYVPQSLARDTDIYSGFQANSVDAVKPNILLLLDTSDSMNIPEGWREYAGDYDSHVEYLWADTGLINSSAQYDEHATRIALGMREVTSMTAAGTTATITTSGNHGYAVGWSVTLANAIPSAYNGTFVITDVPTASTFKVTLGSAPSSGASKSITVNGSAVTSITRSSSTATATRTGHGFSVGDSVTIAGASHPYYNGTFTIASVPSANTFTYVMKGDPGGAAAAAMWAMSQNPVPSSRVGFWAGSTPEERLQLWRAAYDSAIAVHPDDASGFPRNTYRNYNNANWIYWLPAGTAETDPRLREPSFNRWAGGLRRLGGVRGGIDFGSNDDFRASNLCETSKAAFMPSTVLAPTAYDRNTGKYLGAQWQRWERWLNLVNGRLADGDTIYPTTVGTDVTPSSGRLPIATGSATGTVGATISARNEYLGSPATAGTPVRDSWPNFPNFGDGTTNIGQRGQPIRTKKTESKAGWTNLKADLGGFNYAEAVNGYTSSVLVNVLKSYQATYGGIAPTNTNATSLAWKGNRDETPAAAFGSQNGTPAYFDSPATNLKLGTASSTICTRTCDVDSDPGVGGNQAVSNASPLNDARNNTRYWMKSGATCQSTGTSGSDCSTLPAACGTPTTSNYFQTDYTGCAWSGRQSKYVEGEGTYYYGGTCTGSCYGPGRVLGGAPCPSATSASYCAISGTSTVVRGGVTMDNAVLGSSTSGCGDIADLTQTCASRQGQAGCNWTADADPCADPSVTATGAATDYSVYSNADRENYLYHDCKADNGTAGNPSNSFLSAPGNVANSQFTAWSAVTGANRPYVTTDPGLTYPAVDMYSVNYLNWKFGPRGPNGHPIGRKTRLQIAKDVLTDVVSELRAADSKVRIGLMSFNQMENASPRNSPGAHLDKAIVDLTDLSKSALVSRINALNASAATPLTESLYEAYLYFQGKTPKFGTLTTTAKIGGVINAGVDSSADAMTGSAYKSPITQTCQENLVILVSDGAPENDDQANAEIVALPATGSASIPTTQPNDPSTGQPFGPKDANPTTSGNDWVYLDELAAYMNTADAIDESILPGTQRVKLSTVGFAGVNAPVLARAAAQGGGNAYNANDAAALKQSILDAIQSISQWQPQASSPGLTYSVTAGSSEDAYIGAIAPSTNVAWLGTMKKFKFGFGESQCGPASCGNPDICLIGQTEIDAACKFNIEKLELDSVLGQYMRKIRPEAVSYWGATASPDGGSGTAGGTGQVLIDPSRQPGDRKLYTFISSVTGSDLTASANAVASANTNVTKTLLGDAVMTNAKRDELIAFALGSDGSNTTSWRSWAQFDATHSRPITDKDGSGNETLYFLTSDGVMHAVDVTNGQERWAFMVEEGLSKINVMKVNNAGEHLEVADGNPVLVTTLDNKRLLVFGMRRGGRAYYAIDVTSVAAPKLAWKIGSDKVCTGGTCSNSTTYSELGYTWSTPVVGTVRGYKDNGADGTAGTADDKLKPVLIFAGGYDPNQDSATAGVDSMGRAIFVVDAADGSLIRKLDLNYGGASYSAPADVLALDTTGDTAGTIDRVYVGDMGGNLWRADLDDRSSSNSPSAWSVVLLAKLMTTARKVKLFNKPTMAPTSFKNQIFDAVFIGGGDSQRPTDNSAALSGAMYMVKDYTVTGVAQQETSVPNADVTGTFVDMTDQVAADALQTVTNVSASGSTLADDLIAASGWVINFVSGEKVTSDAQVFGGRLFFGTYLPRQTSVSAGACIVGGYGRQFVVEALSGAPIRKSDGNLMYPGSTNFDTRSFASVYGMGRPLSLIGDSKKPLLGGPLVPAQGTNLKPVRVFWYSVPER